MHAASSSTLITTENVFIAVLLIFSHESDTGVPGRGRKWASDWGKGNEVEVTAKDYGRNAWGLARHLGDQSPQAPESGFKAQKKPALSLFTI
jgi:hypothetical protein